MYDSADAIQWSFLCDFNYLKQLMCDIIARNEPVILKRLKKKTGLTINLPNLKVILTMNPASLYRSLFRHGLMTAQSRNTRLVFKLLLLRRHNLIQPVKKSETRWVVHSLLSAQYIDERHKDYS